MLRQSGENNTINNSDPAITNENEHTINIQPTEADSSDETTPLIPQDPKPSRAAAIASTASQVALAVVGMGAGVLYLGPAEQCVESEQCGKFLADLAGKGFAIGVFAGSGVNFSIINAYMSGKSVSALIESIRKAQTTKEKIGKGTVIIAYALTQNASLLLASLGTSSKIWQTALTVGGGAPGALFGAVGIIDKEIPRAWSAIKQAGRHMQEFLLNCCSPLDPVTATYFKRMRHYEKLQKEFLERLQFRSNDLHRRALAIEANGESNPLTCLFKQPFDAEQKSYFASGMHMFGKATGIAVAGVYSTPFTLNTFTMLGKYIAILPLRIGATIFLSASSLYGNFKLTTHGITGFIDTLTDVLRGKPIKSSIFHLRPKTTLLVLGAAVTLSAFSYAVANILFAKEIPDDKNEVRNGFLYGASVGIDIYHLAGLFEFFRLAYSKLTRNEQERFIFLMEQEIERLQKMPLEQFIEFIEKNTAELNTLLELQSYQHEGNAEEEPSQPQPNAKEPVLPRSPSANDEPVTTTPSTWTRFTNWLCCDGSDTLQSPDPEPSSKREKAIMTIM